ncbi:MAG: CDP-alcohol phosphatidyltransferase family protein [Myxococcales bacterium]|nr:CDP-alcohol phosphatidyltransferase family protein [Myxococcales bacterium]
MTFDALVLAIGPNANRRVGGMSLVDRARRVAEKAGADVVHIVTSASQLQPISQAFGAKAVRHGLLIIDGATQVVHMPLVLPMLDESASRPHRKAIAPDGTYAGALYCVDRATAVDAISKLAEYDGDHAKLAASWGDMAEAFVHGDIARHPATTRVERKAALDMLLRLVHKSTDNAITRYLYRPVSRPLTKFFLMTPITPNQISALVGILGVIGCVLVARGNHADLVLGSALVVIAGFIDCCDGEVARLRHLSSKLGAWLDTLIDEFTSVGYIVALGLHCHNRQPEAWVLPTLWTGIIGSALSLYIIYYFDLRVAKTGNSQNYVGNLALLGDDAASLRLTPVRPSVTTSPLAARAMPLIYAVVRRDFVNLACLAMAIADVFRFNFAIMALATTVMTIIIVPEHLKLRRLLARFAALGAPIRYAP